MIVSYWPKTKKGWDKNSYGYHGDDGHSFCCSGTGQTYGPTFTTGDVIGCCLNLIENTCFYTKNGFNLGIAFRDLPVFIFFFFFSFSYSISFLHSTWFNLFKTHMNMKNRVTCIRQWDCRHRPSLWRPTLASTRLSLTFSTTWKSGISRRGKRSRDFRLRRKWRTTCRRRCESSSAPIWSTTAIRQRLRRLPRVWATFSKRSSLLFVTDKVGFILFFFIFSTLVCHKFSCMWSSAKYLQEKNNCCFLLILSNEKW